MHHPEDIHFRLFNRTIGNEELPVRFTYPFYYIPHPLAKEAAELLMNELETSNLTPHNFGLGTKFENNADPIGKMFGVLVVKNKNGDIGYLRAFSGKINNSNQLEGFVPPIFDTRNPNLFYVQGEHELNQINEEIRQREKSPEYLQSLSWLEKIKAEAEQDISTWKAVMREHKAERRKKRDEAICNLSPEEYRQLEEQLVRQSLHDQWKLKQLQKEYREKIAEAEESVRSFELEIQQLKQLRKEKSAALQQKLFEQYNFINQYGETKNVKHIFEAKNLPNPPSGAGECATTKLIQYAFLKGYQPLCMAEFWWGISPESEILRHKQFYPACRGKCEPILEHMLKGIETDPNPMAISRSLSEDLETLYEDEHIIVVNKPAEMLSVPGKYGLPNVQSILQEKFPHATGPILVHRLDMSTSGILIGGKTKEVHQYLQAQFIKRTVKKRYTALLEGIPKEKNGIIKLPLRVDLDNRPHQIVCFQYGKAAETHYEVIETYTDSCKVWLYPITGRTHQLRVHMAHHLGLGIPIKGDDLYGNMADRLYLHAGYLEIKHPVTKERMRFIAPDPF